MKNVDCCSEKSLERLIGNVMYQLGFFFLPFAGF